MQKLPFPLSLWPVPERLPEHPDIIVPLDYGVDLNHRNANATTWTLHRAITFKQIYPNAKIVFGTSSHCFEGSDEVSTKEKKVLLKHYHLSEGEDFVYAGSVLNTVNEAKVVNRMLYGKSRWIPEVPKEALLICDRLHSRSTLLIYRQVLPSNMKISLVYSMANAWQEDHIFPSLRTMSRWFTANLKRHLALRVRGYHWVEKHGIHKTD